MPLDIWPLKLGYYRLILGYLTPPRHTQYTYLIFLIFAASHDSYGSVRLEERRIPHFVSVVSFLFLGLYIFYLAY